MAPLQPDLYREEALMTDDYVGTSHEHQMTGYWVTGLRAYRIPVNRCHDGVLWANKLVHLSGSSQAWLH